MFDLLASVSTSSSSRSPVLNEEKTEAMSLLSVSAWVGWRKWHSVLFHDGSYLQQVEEKDLSGKWLTPVLLKKQLWNGSCCNSSSIVAHVVVRVVPASSGQINYGTPPTIHLEICGRVLFATVTVVERCDSPHWLSDSDDIYFNHNFPYLLSLCHLSLHIDFHNRWRNQKGCSLENAINLIPGMLCWWWWFR